jgi:hypothetical protein
MKLLLRRCALLLLGVVVLCAWQGAPQDEPARLPNGKLQRDEILKAEHEQNLKDAAKLVDLAQELKEEMEKNDRYVLSISTLKKTDDIEKLVRKIRSRMRRS